ncbi:MAG: Hpt domain-containing protein [Bacteroidales bacterium]
MDEKLYNLDSLRKLLNDDTEEVEEMIQMFTEIAPSTLSEMQEAYEEENFEELGKLAHKLKGNLRLLNIHSLDETMLNLEKCSKEMRNLDKVNPLMQKLHATLPKVIEQLRNNELEYKKKSG